MRPVIVGVSFFAVIGLLIAACGQDPATSTTGTTGTGGAPNCEAVIIVEGEDAGNTCDVCLHKKCCAEVAGCADKYCKDCVNLYSAGCEANAHVNALNNCIDLYCFDSSSCNPKPPHPATTGGSAASTSSGG